MDDLISRQDVIKFIRNNVSLSTFMKRSVQKADEACWDLCDKLNQVPSAQQWIPVSERQPEETNLYWVTVKPIDSEMFEVTPRWYFGRGYGDGWEAELYEPPLAWMPMEWPEPWRGEEG